MYFLLLSLTICYVFASPAVKHAHTHGLNHLNQERTQDGAYIHRDHGHITEDGEHHSEFDHEAILGKSCCETYSTIIILNCNVS